LFVLGRDNDDDESIFMQSISNDTALDHTTLDDASHTYDPDYGPHSPYDTLPTPADVERAFHHHDGGDVKAWFDKHGIDAEPIGKIIRYGIDWNPETGRYQFTIYDPTDVGPDHPAELAVPIFKDGVFIDLLFISDSMSVARATCRVSWLGAITPTTRLHPHPLDWIEAGCTGACHVEPLNRKALKDLRAATTIECNDINTTLEAWDWGFAGDDDELARFALR
jgi:hypothetical protein